MDIIGLFTSPHLIEVRERIRINGKPLSKEMFAKYFFECWNLLDQAKVRFRLFCVLSFSSFFVVLTGF